MFKRILCVFLLVGCASTGELDPESEMRNTDPPTITVVPLPTTSTLPVETPTTTSTTTTTTIVDLGQIQAAIQEAQDSYGPCGEWHDLAISVGWPEEEWPTLSKVMFRESRCQPTAWNQGDVGSGSRGLLQVNSYWCDPSRWTANGWLQDRNLLTSCDDLFQPEVALRSGLAIWLYGEDKHGCGWIGPWRTPCN